MITTSFSLQVEEEKIEKVEIWLEPQLIRNIEIFLDLGSIYRKFTKNFG